MATQPTVKKIADTVRDPMTAINDFTTNKSYDISQIKPEIGSTIEVQTRNTNLAINNTSITTPYGLTD